MQKHPQVLSETKVLPEPLFLSAVWSVQVNCTNLRGNTEVGHAGWGVRRGRCPGLRTPTFLSSPDFRSDHKYLFINWASKTATFRRQYELETVLEGAGYYPIKEEKKRSQFGPKNEEVFSRWSGNDRHEHFKLWQWMNMYRGKCLLTNRLDWLRHKCYPVMQQNNHNVHFHLQRTLKICKRFLNIIALSLDGVMEE